MMVACYEAARVRLVLFCFFVCFGFLFVLVSHWFALVFICVPDGWARKQIQEARPKQLSSIQWRSRASTVAQAQLVATSLLANHARQARFQH